MKNRNQDHKDTWATPKYFYDKLNAEFNFDFDPCPLNPNFDGLSVNWGERNFINPPYSQKLKEAFIRKALEESRKGKLCVLLLPVSTSTKIFHEVIKPNAKEIRFIHGRIKFNFNGIYDPERNGGQHDSMIVIFDPNYSPARSEVDVENIAKYIRDTCSKDDDCFNCREARRKAKAISAFLRG